MSFKPFLSRIDNKGLWSVLMVKFGAPIKYMLHFLIDHTMASISISVVEYLFSVSLKYLEPHCNNFH